MSMGVMATARRAPWSRPSLMAGAHAQHERRDDADEQDRARRREVEPVDGGDAASCRP